MKKVYSVTLKQSTREEIIESMKNEINKVCEYHKVSPTQKTLNIIFNKSIDQVNKHVSQKATLKKQWILDSAQSVPVLVDVDNCEDTIDNAEPTQGGTYKKGTDEKWSFNDEPEGVSREAFRRQVIEDLKEDARIAAFYGALSYVTE